MRALLSVYDKEGLVAFDQGLSDLGWEMVASGNTSATLTEAGIAHLEVADVTGSPEMLGGRVKTLHPKSTAASSPTARSPSTATTCRPMASKPSTSSCPTCTPSPRIPPLS